MTPAAFIAKLRHVELKERSAAQEHFLDATAKQVHEIPLDALGEPPKNPPVSLVAGDLRGNLGNFGLISLFTLTNQLTTVLMNP